jgi:site-specific DNA-methyltransferase (adenine-specific)
LEDILIDLILDDCMNVMSKYEDNHFDLAIVDPPYGLGTRTTDGGSKKNTQTKFMESLKKKQWDNSIPDDNYFKELKRVSKNQIVWGGNYFPLSKYRHFIVWDKMTYIPTMSRVELAYTSFDKPAVYIEINSNQKDRIHPTQKPVDLYSWLLHNYAEKGQKILDTHLGSGSIAVAAHYFGVDLVGVEIDEEYYNKAKERVDELTKQTTMF